MSTSYRGRFAPTPSGPLHLGNLRTALLAWLLARQRDGRFVLRIDDLDRPRVRHGATAAALADLRWLGLDWDEGPDCGGAYAPYTQSERRSLYAAHLQRLAAAGLIYPCYCSRSEVARVVRAPHDAEEGPRYPGTCRDPARRAERQRQAGGRPPCLRFRVPEGPLSVVDGLYGRQTYDVAATVGDFVVFRADGVPSYQCAVVVDDALMAVTEVVRGADLLASTPRQVMLYRALGYPLPRFLHLPLLHDPTGARLAKRDGAAGVAPLRAAGRTPAEVVGALAASVGLVPPGTVISATELCAISDRAHLTLTHIQSTLAQ